MNELIEKLVLGQLSGRKKKDALAAIASDPEAAELYAILKDMADTRDALKSSGVGSASGRLSVRMFQDVRKGITEKGAARAVIVFDSADLPVPEGVRPAAVDTRNLKYKLDQCEIELTLYPITPDSFELIGQISGLPEGDDIAVELIGGRSTQRVQADKFHLFRFARVPASSLKLYVRKSGKRIVTLDIEQ